MKNMIIMGNSSSNTTLPTEHNWFEISGIWAIIALIIFSIVGDILTLFIVKRTHTLKSYTGDLLISQVSSCIPRQLLSLVLIFSYHNIRDGGTLQSARYTLRLLVNGFQGITSHTLAAICLNLYFAICHSLLYKSQMSRVYVLVFIPLCWIVNLSVGLCPLASMNPLFVPEGIIHAPSYEGTAFSAWLFIDIFVFIIPAVVTAFAFIRIWAHSRKVRPVASVNVQFRDKFLLAKVIVGFATCYISLWSLMHFFRTMQTKYSDAPFRLIAHIPYFLNLFYDAFKLGVYLLAYKPIRMTVIELCRKKRRVELRITTVETLQTEEMSASHV